MIQSAIHPLEQLKTFLQQLEPEQYTQALPILSGSSIGMHSRHIIEFYQCLLKGHDTGNINYEARDRDLELENNIVFAMSSIDILVERLPGLNGEQAVHVCCSAHQEHSYTVSGTIARELNYITEHTIHHMAILKMACLSAFPSISFGQDFGVAYSTIKYRERVHSNLSA